MNLPSDADEVTDNIYNYGYRTPRFRVSLHLFLQVDDPHGEIANAHCTDMSEAGLAAEVKIPLEIGAKVTLIFTLPGTSTPMRIVASVVHRQIDRYGFVFAFSSQSQRDTVHAYLESRYARMF
jgi:hypothetical protein